MVNKKVVPKGATESVATLVYPPEFTDECPSNWYVYINANNYINFSVFALEEEQWLSMFMIICQFYLLN